MMEQLSSDQLMVGEVTDRGLTGNITCKQDEVLLFTIPYDEGFEVWIDGKECDTWAYLDAFLANTRWRFITHRPDLNSERKSPLPDLCSR